MASLNKVMLIGNLGRDPEVSYTPGGMAVAKVALATTDIWNDKATGEKRERTEWHRVTFFGKQAETIGRYMTKGKQMYVEGKLQTSSYEKDGITRYSTDIIANNFQFLGQRDQGQGQGYQQGGPGGYQQPNQGCYQGGGQHGPYNQQPKQGYDSDSSFNPPPDDDIPF